jgi:hypothetical protein
MLNDLIGMAVGVMSGLIGLAIYFVIVALRDWLRRAC